MRVKKSYGIVADHGRKQLKLEKIYNVDREIRLGLVSYKDGMSVNVLDITEEAKELKRFLEEYLDYKTPEKEVIVKEKSKQKTKPKATEFNVIDTLVSLPATDVSYQSTLRKATVEELEEAINRMKKSGEKGNLTRIRFCETRLKSLKKKSTPITTKKESTPKKESAPKKETTKILTFPTEDKKPKIIQLVTKGDATYEECEAKLNKEGKMFKDHDSQYVITGLKELCKVDADFRNNLMRKEKTYGGFLEYMEKAARNGYCLKYGNVSYVDCDTGLALAIDYYNNDEEKAKAIAEEEAKKKTEETKKKIKTATAKKAKTTATKNAVKKVVARKR